MVGGSATHAASRIPRGRSGPGIHFLSFIVKISVDLEYCSLFVYPPSTIMHFVFPLSDGMAQAKCRSLPIINDGPSVQSLAMVS